MTEEELAGVRERARAPIYLRVEDQTVERALRLAFDLKDDLWLLLAEIERLGAALAEAEARAARAQAEDDYPSAVFRELWRVLGELRAATGEEGRA